MNLDPRIEDRIYIFDCFNSKMASKYIGKVCYLSNDIAEFSDLDLVDIDTLQYIGEECFYGSDKQFAFCLPFDFVKEKEKEYKPFDPETFEKHYDVGSVIKYRRKCYKSRSYKSLVEDISYDEQTKEFFVILRGIIYTLNDLFEEYELYENGKWKPFGVKE